MRILIPILALTGLGVAFGAGLALASKKFRVVVDPRLEEVFKKLPGVNCGACGMGGCMGFAQALIEGRSTPDKCVVAKEEARREIARILGVEEKERAKKVAVLHCHGGNIRAKDKFIYSGVKDCILANLVMAGPKACIYGCIGYGTCAQACPFGAITMNEEGLPVVDEAKCTGCGSCVAACPKKLFSLVPVSKNYNVRCRSLDMGKAVMDVCSVGCIGCRKCEKACPVHAIRIADNLSIIDYNICENKGECFKSCPTKAIAARVGGAWRNQ